MISLLMCNLDFAKLFNQTSIIRVGQLLYSSIGHTIDNIRTYIIYGHTKVLKRHVNLLGSM